MSLTGRLHKFAEHFRRVERSEQMLLRFEILLEQVNHKLDAISTELQNQSAGRAASEAALAHSQGLLNQRVSDQFTSISSELQRYATSVANSEEGIAQSRVALDSLARHLETISRDVQKLREGSPEPTLRQLHRLLLDNSHSLLWLAQQIARETSRVPAVGPLVSILMPTWNRGHIIERAIQSVLDQSYQRWEWIIVDDGSTDNTRKKVARYLADPRVHYFERPHLGAAAARNFGLSKARGELIAYLDTDNLWMPGFLAGMVTAFAEDSELLSAYAAQFVHDHSTGFSCVRATEFDFEDLSRENYIDMNIFVHRRRLFDRYGGFDEGLERLCDWDLILRYTEQDKTRLVPVLGGIYNQFWSADQISMTYNYNYNRYRVRSKRSRPAQAPLKVLYALWHYPQLSESYARTEIEAVRQLGVEVEVWSEEDVVAPFESEVPVYRGTLRDALARVKPDLVHSHWLDMAEKYSEEVSAAGLPLTVRGHGFEFSPSLVARLDQNPTVKAAYVFPHLLAQCSAVSEKIKSIPVTFDPARYSPNPKKDRRMVMRTGCALPTKDYLTFMQAAQLCPNHRFVLVLCTAYKVEAYVDELNELKNRLGAPVELLYNQQLEDLAPLMSQAGIYLHTNGPSAPFGMPISISEAMATGSYIIGRRCPGAVNYIQEAGSFYDTAEEAAALIRQTETWNDEQWRHAYLRSVERAFGNFISTEVLAQIVSDWRSITGKTADLNLSEQHWERPGAGLRGAFG